MRYKQNTSIFVPLATLHLLCLLLLSPGCGQGSKCTSDNDCPAGQACQTNTCQPIVQDGCINADGGPCAGCNSDSDCPTGQRCQNKQCTNAQTCKSDDDCKNERLSYCSEAGTCSWECKEDAHCAGKTKAFCSTAHACEWDCKQDTDCPAGKSCQGNTCNEDLACKSDADCVGKTRPYCSDAGQCEWQCKADTDCRPKETTKCDARNGIEQNPACKQGERCLLAPGGEYHCLGGLFFCSDEHVCAWACREDKDCPFSRRCQNNTCVKKEDFCERGTCPQGETCNNGRCYEACSLIPPTKACPDAQQTCFQSSCRTKCDLHNPTCPAGTVCHYFQHAYDPDDLKKVEETAFCERVMAYTTPYSGAGKEGDACGGSSLCDWNQGFFCNLTSSRCRKSCDPTKGTQNNPDCKAGQRCIFSFFTNPTLAQRGGHCVTPGTQKEGEDCSPSFQEDKDRCDKETYCQIRKGQPWERSLSSVGLCMRPCDPSKGVLNNPACRAEQECKPRATSPTKAVCTAKEGQEGDPCGDNKPCAASLVCEQLLGTAVCSKACKEDKDCGTNQACVLTSTNKDAPRYCRDKCDPAQGFVLNPTCKKHYFCEATPRKLGEDTCLPLALSVRQLGKGNTPLYELCGLAMLPKFVHCDTDKGQACLLVDGLHTRCVQMCDPRQGLLSNPTCGGAVCKEWVTATGGVCERLGTAKEGEACAIDKGCDKGLVCYGFQCVKACDPRKTDACPQGELCWRQRCVKTCDVKQGVLPNPGCRSGLYCSSPIGIGPLGSTTHASGLKVATCESNASPAQGPKQEGEACLGASFAVSRHCDGKKGLLCDDAGDGICRPGCDPYKGFANNPACKSGQFCVSGQPHLLNYGPRSLGGVCAFVCDPANENTGECPAETYCQRGIGNRNTYGLCSVPPPKRQGPRELGESCLNTQTLACNSSKELYCQYREIEPAKACQLNTTPSGCGTNEECLDFNGASGRCHIGACVQGCDPQASTNRCKTGESCVEDPSSPFGGTCAPKPTRLHGETCTLAPQECPVGSNACPPSADNCIDGLCIKQSSTSNKGSCRKFCDPAQERIGNSPCPAGTICGRSPTIRQPSYCAALAQKPKGTRQLGEACTLTERCDGSKDLFCAGGQCHKSCDRNTGQGCATNEVCAININSPTGAGCFPKVPEAKEDEVCSDDLGRFCASGLLCGCLSKDTYDCFCTKKQVQAGNYCNGGYWQCATGLVCWGGRCLTECDISKGTSANPACKASETCKTSVPSTLGGMCHPS